MNWAKFVLFFQAVATLVIGIIFFVQLLIVYRQNLEKLSNFDMVNQESGVKELQDSAQTLEHKFKTASYVLVVVSLIEIIIISRLI